MSDQRVDLITGSSSGFGRQVALKLARRGDRVYATMRGPAGKNRDTAAELRTIAEAENLDIRTIDLDVASDASVEAAVEQIIAESNRIDVVVNNAGQMYLGIAEGFTHDQFSNQLEVNLVGVYRVTRAVLPHMREQNSGLIVNLTSVAGRIAFPFYALYCASKWGLEGLSECLRYELVPKGIDVVVVEPGPFQTDLLKKTQSTGKVQNFEGYPELDSLWTDFMAWYEPALTDPAMLDDPEAQVDPELVSDAIVELVETPAGERPFRNVVGLDLGTVRELNATTEPFRLRPLAAFGAEHLVGLGAQAANPA
jgi:NAD(P)-dependent dehydrogenase (short-subunit alcohol dehydrogenase family)